MQWHYRLITSTSAFRRRNRRSSEHARTARRKSARERKLSSAIRSLYTRNACWNTSNAGSNWSSGEQQGMRSYHCPTCGAELVTDETTAASTCAYCGSPVVLSDHLSGAKRPNYVIPFKVDKKTAKETLKNFYKGKIFLPLFLLKTILKKSAVFTFLSGFTAVNPMEAFPLMRHAHIITQTVIMMSPKQNIILFCVMAKLVLTTFLLMAHRRWMILNHLITALSLIFILIICQAMQHKLMMRMLLHAHRAQQLA